MSQKSSERRLYSEERYLERKNWTAARATLSKRKLVFLETPYHSPNSFDFEERQFVFLSHTLPTLPNSLQSNLL